MFIIKCFDFYLYSCEISNIWLSFFRELYRVYISELLHLKDPNTTYELRTNQERYILRTDQKSHFKKTQGAFSQRAPYIWNSLPICVRAQTDISMFKSALKTHYYEQAFGWKSELDLNYFSNCTALVTRLNSFGFGAQFKRFINNVIIIILVLNKRSRRLRHQTPCRRRLIPPSGVSWP